MEPGAHQKLAIILACQPVPHAKAMPRVNTIHTALSLSLRLPGHLSPNLTHPRPGLGVFEVCDTYFNDRRSGEEEGRAGRKPWKLSSWTAQRVSSDAAYGISSPGSTVHPLFHRGENRFRGLVTRFIHSVPETQLY